MASTNPTILSTGDITADWSFVDLAGASTSGIDMAWAWSEGYDVRAVSFAGGAMRAAELLEAAAAQAPQGSAPRILKPRLSAEMLSSPLDPRITRTFSSVAQFPRSRTDRSPVWRFSRFWGRNQSAESTDHLPDLSGEHIDVVTIHDLNLGYREAPDAWSAWEAAGPSAIVLSTVEPFAGNALLRHLLERHADKLSIVVPIVELRKSGAPIGYPLSWERSAEEVDAAVRGGLLGGASRVVVQLELSGALIVERSGATTLVFDPSVPEGAWAAARPGLMPAYPLCYLAALALPLAADEPFDAVEAVRRAVQATRVLLNEGLHAGKGDADWAFSYPMEAVARALHEEPGEIHATLHPRPDGSTTIIAGTIGPEAMLEAAVQLALGGPESLPPGVPVENVGNWSSVDRREIETLRGVGHVIDEYVKLYRGGGNVQRPLSVAVFGPPGAGKSFAVKETIGQKVAGGVRTLEFNLSQFENADELAPAFHQVRDAALEQQLPLVFWDEFDTPLAGRDLGWLRHFLAPMQDGKFREGGRFHPLGPALFVFAGGTASSFTEFVQVHDAHAEKSAKKPDFVSRLRGYVDILGPNRTRPDDDAVVLRRALLLRSLLMRKEPQLVTHKDGRKVLRIDPALLRAFLVVGHYRHGARSLEAIIDMSQLAGTLHFERSSLPAPHLLELHVDAGEFLQLVHG